MPRARTHRRHHRQAESVRLRTDLTPDELLSQAQRIGLVVAAQSNALAPADGKIYALRDATGTVDSHALIASSIMSKKLAGGAEAIVLDVTVGSGAFMQTVEEARALAGLMVRIGRRAGRRMAALLTEMSRPLGRAVGNAVEVEEAASVLAGGGPRDVRDTALAVAAWMPSPPDCGRDDPRGLPMAPGDRVMPRGGCPDDRGPGRRRCALDRTLLGHRPAQIGHWGEDLSGTITRMDARIGHAARGRVLGAAQRDSVDPPPARIIGAEGERTRRGGRSSRSWPALPRTCDALAELDRAIVVRPPAQERRAVIDVIPPEDRA